MAKQYGIYDDWFEINIIINDQIQILEEVEDPIYVIDISNVALYRNLIDLKIVKFDTIQGLEVLENMTQLQELILEGQNELSDLRFLENLNNLTLLNLF